MYYYLHNAYELVRARSMNKVRVYHYIQNTVRYSTNGLPVASCVHRQDDKIIGRRGRGGLGKKKKTSRDEIICISPRTPD